MANLVRTAVAGSMDVGLVRSHGKETQRHLKNGLSLSLLQGSLASKDWTAFPSPRASLLFSIFTLQPVDFHTLNYLTKLTKG